MNPIWTENLLTITQSSNWFFLYNHDKILNHYWMQPKVKLNQPPHTYNEQTITTLVKIFLSQHNLFMSLSYKNLIFRHQYKSRENQAYLTQRIIRSSNHLTSDSLKLIDTRTTLSKCHIDSYYCRQPLVMVDLYPMLPSFTHTYSKRDLDDEMNTRLSDNCRYPW